MKNILVLMHDDAGQEARFQAALDVARAIDGHLTCVDICIVPPFVGDYAGVDGTSLLLAEERQRESVNRERMQARLRAEDVAFDWIDESGFLGRCVRDAAAMTDVVVLNREIDDINSPDMLELVGDVLIKGRKPIVAVPSKAKGFNAFGHALIAWDGSRQAEAALRAAVPLLQCASEVTILAIDDGSIRIPANEAAEYLSRHGVKSVVREEQALGESPSTLILRAVTDLKAAHLVMGGFGHSRFVEAVLGGVTRRMLKECPVPLFLAH